jgi:hypothetical protein
MISIQSGTSPADRIGAEEIVLLAIFSDIHANRQAFGACLDAASGAERMICWAIMSATVRIRNGPSRQ